ncbi:uroporphyrinogen decarboxylase family protein [Methanonatronarchaeum sp. AMET-Sl]|uniref:uroporphyrinogen decarboxylase family protein n=1 Tax=Methanonatronarchaeum sp. AMET-Sl TaxID=3037654 RepID=UPI00244D9D5C|nr:uroporphyrinogen decarboxylase family protein [Methanonatronarchaeum sp. AMET-Sl]WGI18104.1 uroporphyrinogen decarboxylase family protein [Methanonatronarchaeum sp. AMET-Sl]
MKGVIMDMLRGGETDRAVCVSLSGCQGMTPVEIQEKTGVFWPKAHQDPDLMTDLVMKSMELTGFENVRVPFDACVEPEALGAEVKWGDEKTDPYITKYPYTENPLELEIPDDITTLGRIPVIIECISQLDKELSDVVIGSTVMGPITLVGELIGTENLLRKTLTDPKLIRDLVERVKPVTLELISLYSDAGSDVVQVIEPSCSNDMIPPNTYKDIAHPIHKEIAEKTDTPTILHICGQIDEIIPEIAGAGYNAITIHSGINPIKTKKQTKNNLKILGDISPDSQANATPKKVEQEVKKAIQRGIDFIEPYDGVVSTAKLKNLQTMTKTTKQTQ